MTQEQKFIFIKEVKKLLLKYAKLEIIDSK